MDLSSCRSLSTGLIGFLRSCVPMPAPILLPLTSLPSEVQAFGSPLFPSVWMTTLVKDCDDNDPVVSHHKINCIREPMKQGSSNPLIEFGELQWECGDPLDQLTQRIYESFSQTGLVRFIPLRRLKQVSLRLRPDDEASLGHVGPVPLRSCCNISSLTSSQDLPSVGLFL